VSLLRTQQLSLQQRDRLLVEQLSFEIRAGQCWVVLGTNGSGKSTLLKTLAGVQASTSGEVWLNDVQCQSLSPRQRAQQVGLIFQHSHLGFHSSALEMVLSGGFAQRSAWGFESPEEIAQATRALQAVGLQALAAQPLESLSGGELRRAEIARLLVQSPKLAMLDEPLNHLDLAQQVTMLQLLRKHFCNTEHALLMVLHDINLALHTASHLLLLKGDGNWQAGRVEELGNAETLSATLGFPLRRIDTPHGSALELDFEQTGLAPSPARE